MSDITPHIPARKELPATHAPASPCIDPRIIRPAPSEDVTFAIAEYRRIQEALDKALPDCIMTTRQGKSFRKKSYWRALSTAFSLHVEEMPGSEQALGPVLGEDTDFSISVTYRAIASNGRFATGDGACSASEKWSYDKGTGEVTSKKQGTYHNVRSHAHTRAYNRAVSNLVGFGEVSAEEVVDTVQARPAAARAARVISAKQRSLIWARARQSAKRTGMTAELVVQDVLRRLKLPQHTDQIPATELDRLLVEVDAWIEPPDDGPPDDPTDYEFVGDR